MMKAGKFYRKEFNVEALKHLYEVGLQHIQMREQWLDMKKFTLAAEYENKATAIAEVMEGITVMSHGDGADGFKGKVGRMKTVDQRIKSFESWLK